MAAAPILRVEAMTKSFDGVSALRDGSLELRPGEIHALAGENGAGKSTLIRILAGLLLRDGGRIVIDGHETDINNPAGARELGIAVIHQEFDLPPNLSVAESLLLGREPAHPLGFISMKEYRQRAGECLRSIGVEMDTDSFVDELSISQRQLVAIARAVSSHARILIMDEPTSALATDEIDQLLDLVLRLKEQGTAILYISHKMEEVFRISDRITVFRDGAFVGTRETGHTSVGEIVNMMVGRDLEDIYARTAHARGAVLLEVRDLYKKGIFSGINFELGRGEVLGLYGLKGAGRSEMVGTLFGLDTPDSGAILIDGSPVTIDSPGAAVDLGIALLPEDRHVLGLFPNMSVRDNMSVSILDRLERFGFISRGREQALAETYRQRLNIRADDLEQAITTLSGGNQQKVMLARWLMCEPKVLILDEPTAGIDVGARSEIYRLINRLAGDGLGVILVSSELPEILGMSDRLLVMHDGEIAAHFTRNEATEERILHAIHSQRDSRAA